MTDVKSPKFYNIASIICGTWFLLTGWMWAYLVNIVFSFPVGAVGIYLWYKGKRIDPHNRANKAALIIHIAGLAISVVTFFALYFFG
jgi:hypothetical protein